MKKLVHLAALALAFCLLAGCEQDNSNSTAVKPNPEMANRYKQPANVGAGGAPKGVGAVPSDPGAR
jgi:PBP1b-binding outer membrane lipoprotein LpoB